MKKAISLLLCVLFLFNLCSCNFSKNEAINLTAMNTLMQIRVFSSLKGKKETAKLFENEILRLEALFDEGIAESDVYKINNCDSQCRISSETAKIIESASFASKKTNGAFDITIMPVLRLWGFDNGNYGVPEKNDIETALLKVGSDNIKLNGAEITKKNGTEISLGGIAKGYLGDRLLKIAEENEICAVVSLGGNIVLCGENREKGYWTVGVKNPISQNELACTFESEGNLSVVTSGGYERYFEKDGKTFHHIIDTKTGEPARSDLLSVTVIGKNGALCDAYSTALFAMGKEKAVAFAKENNDFKYIFITDENEILALGEIKNLQAESENFKIK